jgi:GalNAc-alpha-(1->4)-GalNAc-alpha-(1->3)-diNAcBac-PP-undecaprenol alpha-1,4-N-acetyl-D-galactosaminyltransferase
MNLLFVIDYLCSGGAQRQMINLARGLKSKGNHVEFFTYYTGNHYRPLLDEAGIPMHLHAKPSRFSIAPFVALRQLIRHGNYDVVLSILDTPNFYAEIARIGLGKTKLVVSEGSMYPPGQLPLPLRLLQECHRLADAITVNSYHQRERMEREFPWMTKKIQTIHNGVDLGVFHPAVSLKRADSKLSLLAIASVSFNKNPLNLAKALWLCRHKYKLDVHVDWIGRQHISGEGTRPVQQTSIYLRDTGMSDLWNWLGERTDISQMLVSHDALIHPSFYEGLPNAICEALACGRPVLVSRVCDHPLLVQDGVTGYLFDPASPEEIANSIFAFSRLGSSQRAKMSKAARDFAEKHLSLNRFVSEHEDLFFSLTQKSKQGH